MRVRLRRLLSLVSGARTQQVDAAQSREGASEPADVARRLDGARQRLKETIPPPGEPAP